MDCFTNYETQMHKNIFVNSKDQRNLLQMKYKSQQTTSTISLCIEMFIYTYWNVSFTEGTDNNPTRI